MPAASLRKLDTTSQSWLVLPNTQGVTGYPCVCLLLAAQLPSWALAVCLVSLLQTCCFYRRHTCATSAFCASEAVHRKVCWLTCCVPPPLKHRLALRNSVGARTCSWSDRYIWAPLYTPAIVCVATSLLSCVQGSGVPAPHSTEYLGLHILMLI